MKRVLCLLLSVVLCIGMFAGCGPTTPTGTGKITDHSDPNAPDLTGVTIRLLTEDTWVSGFSLSDILPRFKQVEARTGCTIIWETIAGGSDYETVVQTRLTDTGNTCPDIVLFETNTGKLANFIEDGIFYDFTKAYDVCPNIKRFWENRPDLAQMFTYNDGGIYNLLADVYDSEEGLTEMTKIDGDNALWYRADIAAELGWDSYPTTLEELHDLLLAVKNKYPDMVPMHMWNWDSWGSARVFSSAYGLHFNNEQFAQFFYPDENGKIQYEATTQACKEFLTEMNKWYEEGLIVVGASEEQKIGSVAAGNTFSGFYADVADLCQDILQETDPDAYFMYMPFPAAEGYEVTYMGRTEYSKSIVVIDNGDEEHNRAVCQFLDYAFMSDYGMACELAGPQGEGWDWDEDGNFKLNEEWLAGVLDGSIVREASGAFVHFNGPSLNDLEMKLAYKEQEDAFIEAHPEYAGAMTEKQKQNWIEINEINTSNYCEIMPQFFMSEEDQREFSRLSADLGTFTSEMISKYILGSEDLSTFESKFVDRLYNKLELQRCIDIQQKYYDAYLEKQQG